MKLAEFAFANQQLAGMIRNGRPLEGALRHLCRDMKDGRLKTELQTLETDLAEGAPLAKAIESRNLPIFYKRMLQVGSQANDVPGVLLLLANYYNRIGIVWDRLKTALFYPIIVLLMATLLSFGLAEIMTRMQTGFFLPDTRYETGAYPFFVHMTWLPVFVLMGLFILTAACCWIPFVRERIKWWMPVSRNTVIAQFASSLSLLLRRGCPLGEAAKFMHELEGNSVLGREMKTWSDRIESGVICFSALGEKTKVLPPTFVWMLEQEAENLPDGLDRAASVYAERAQHQTDLLMNAVAPIGLLVMGVIVGLQVYPAIWWFTQWFSIVEKL